QAARARAWYSHAVLAKISTRCAAAATLLAALAPASAARANGRYPLATQIIAAPSDAAYMALRSTFGVLQTFDGGATWSWVCEQAAGYGDIQDPSIALT